MKVLDGEMVDQCYQEMIGQDPENCRLRVKFGKYLYWDLNQADAFKRFREARDIMARQGASTEELHKLYQEIQDLKNGTDPLQYLIENPQMIYVQRNDPIEKNEIVF